MRVAQNVKCSFLPSFPFKDEHTKCLVELLTCPWYIIVYIGVLHHSPFCWSAREALFIFIVSGSPMASSSSRLRCSTSPAPRASPRTLTVVRKRSLESRNAVNGSSMADGARRVRAYLQGEDNMKRQNYWRREINLRWWEWIVRCQNQCVDEYGHVYYLDQTTVLSY